MKGAALHRWSGEASLKRCLSSRNLKAGRKRNVWKKKNNILPD